jgi:hypothetical protein
VNQSLEMYLRCAANTQPQKWYNWIPLAEFWYNTSHHSAICCSPFKSLYKEEPHYGMLPDLNTTMNTEVKDFLAERQSASDLLKFHLERAQLKMNTLLMFGLRPHDFLGFLLLPVAAAAPAPAPPLPSPPSPSPRVAYP